jgi:prolycopene isomerase
MHVVLTLRCSLLSSSVSVCFIIFGITYHCNFLMESMTYVAVQGNLNLITQALKAVGRKMEVLPDPSTVHFHLPRDLSVLVHRKYEDFINELISKFPHEKEGILKFYGICWKVAPSALYLYLILLCYTCSLQCCYYITITFQQIFNSLNSLELKSLEEPLYLFGQFFRKPLECLTLGI